MKPWRLLLFLPIAGLALIGWMYWTATADPIVRETAVALPGWPDRQASVTALLVSDLHVAGPDMPPARLARIVKRMNALRPDIVLIAGDLVSDKKWSTRTYSMNEAVAPLAQLHAPLGKFAVLGNHDHWRNAGEAREALRRAGVTLIENGAARAGPVTIGGIDDAFIGRDDLAATVRALDRLGGPALLLSHSPDPFPDLPDRIRLMVAGHTHCGQIRLPLIGAISTMSAHGERYACGRIDEGGRNLVVTAGLGTSIVPLRLGAAPDLWLVRLGPERLRRPRVTDPQSAEEDESCCD